MSGDGYAAYLFCEGTNFYAYDLLGAHVEQREGSFLYTFRVWAPNAREIFVCGDFNGWDESLPIEKDADSGIWQASYTSPFSLAGNRYKYKVISDKGTVFKADPYARCSETREKTASVLTDGDAFSWTDDVWRMRRRSFFEVKDPTRPHFYSEPMNIYEVHLGSWKTKNGASTADGAHDLCYREIADELSLYLSDMHYTHVELLPITEYPFDGSWGYQVCGWFAPTSRFGSPADFKYFVNKMHACGIGVILDWVPAHFPKDAHGLYEFDGSLLYEYQGRDRMENRGWGTRYFDVGRPEVQSFLISSALFWMREYHVDGLRIDAVASMLYLDYDREPGEWIPNENGGNQNLEAIAFFRKLNTAVFAEFPDMLMIAEESTAWPMITKPVSAGGLGFNFKWNMGFANDLFAYMATDPIYRKYCHEKLTFPMMYAFSENYILPVSHDEVVHGKKSLLDKMFGSYDEKFAAMRVFLTFMMTHPGKKLLFMGTEFAPFREWDYENELEWFMLRYPRHAEMQRCVKRLNALYLTEPALYEIDDSWDGFAWIDPDDRERSTLSYRRRAISGAELVVVLNFTPVRRERFTVSVPKRGEYEEIFTTDVYEYGGSGVINGIIKSKEHKEKGHMKSELAVTLPAYGGLIFRRREGKKNSHERI